MKPLSGAAGARSEWVVARRLLLVAIVIGVLLRAALLVVLGTSHSPMSEFGIIGANLTRGHGFSYFASFPDQGVIPGIDTGHRVEPAADVGFDRPSPFSGKLQPGAYMPPAYPAVVGLADEITSTRSGQIRVLQVLNLVLFVALAYLLYLLGTALLGPEVGALVALGAAVYPSLIYMSSQVSASNLYLPAECAMLLVAIRAVRAPTNLRMAAAAGALVGVVGLLRPEGIVLGAVIAVLLILAARRAGVSGSRMLQTAAVVLVVAALPVGAWLVRNTVTFGRPVIGITSQAGFVLWAGNHAGATGSGKSFSHGQKAQAAERELFDRAAALPPGRTYELRRDALFRHEAVSWITGHPVQFAGGIVRKVVLFGVADPDDRRSLNPGYLLSWAALVVLAAAGLRRLGPTGPEWRLIAIYAVLSFSIPVLFVVLPRYRVPVDMVLLIPAAWFVSRHPWYERARTALVMDRKETAGRIVVG